MDMNDYKPSTKLYKMITGETSIHFDLPSLMTNSVFYPNADLEWDIDGDPIRLFGRSLHSFVFSCQKLDVEKLAEECRGKGCGATTTLVHETALRVGDIPSHWSLWKYKNKQQEGIGFSLLVMGSSAEHAYAKTYESNQTSPIMVCHISRRGVLNPRLPDWFEKTDPEFVLYGGFDDAQGAYDAFPLKRYQLIEKLQAQVTPGAGTTYAPLHLLYGFSWEKSPEEGGLPRYPCRGWGKRLRLYQRQA
jgi:hypothetical protein